MARKEVGDMKLNLGSGRDYREGWVNLDYYHPHSDVHHDLNAYPYPFKNNTFTEINARHVLEHLTNITRTMEELWRMSKKGALISIVVPHYSHINAFVNPTHIHYFSLHSFDFFTKQGYYNEKYGDCLFEVVSREIKTKNPLLRILPERVAFLFGGIGEIHLVLRVVK